MQKLCDFPENSGLTNGKELNKCIIHLGMRLNFRYRLYFPNGVSTDNLRFVVLFFIFYQISVVFLHLHLLSTELEIGLGLISYSRSDIYFFEIILLLADLLIWVRRLILDNILAFVRMTCSFLLNQSP